MSDDEFRSRVAPPALQLGDDFIEFPETVLLPISARDVGGIGIPKRPIQNLNASQFLLSGLPTFFSLSVQRAFPDSLKSGLRARRTLMEGALNALAVKTGRRPSMAESAHDAAMDADESALSLGRPTYAISFLSSLLAAKSSIQAAQSARRSIESAIRTHGMTPIKLHFVPERALTTLQPGGELFPDVIPSATLFFEDFVGLFPAPEKPVKPAPDSVYIGRHSQIGRDVFFSPVFGFNPEASTPSHAISLILGEMGGGKTTLLRLILLQRLLQGRTVLSLDPEGENNTLCKALGGTVVPAGIPDDEQTCLLHPLETDTPADMLLALRFLMASLIGNEGLTPGIQAVLHEAVQRYWRRHDTKRRASLIEIVEVMGSINDPNAAVPIAILRPYAEGGLWDGYFDRPKALLSPDVERGKWVNFDLSSLTNENHAIVFSVLAWYFYQTVTVGRNPMDIFIDEGWRLLRSGPFGDLLDELGRRARKRGIGITLVTHLPKDLARNTSLSLASYAFVSRIAEEDALGFFRTLGIPESDSRFYAATAARLRPYTFLAVPAAGRGSLFPVDVIIPPLWSEFMKKFGAMK